MRREPWWYAQTPTQSSAPLRTTVTADTVVVGGGFAGLHAARRLAERGAQVVLLEKSCCGGGMSGRSSGFLTPDSELGLDELTSRFGSTDAAAVWQAATDGVRLVVDTAKAGGFDCDLQEVESLFVGIGRSGAKAVEAERAARAALKLPSQVYDAAGLAAVHPGGYSAGLRYGESWTLNPFAYCQALRAHLIELGVRVYEGTEVCRLDGTTAVTTHGAVRATSVVISANRLTAALGRRAYRKYAMVQTFLGISSPLSSADIHAIFPETPMQCWDNRLIYNYYRLTADRRLLLGGGSLGSMLIQRPVRSARVGRRNIAAFRRRFPRLGKIAFEAYWPGLIDVTADLLPIAAEDPERQGVFFVLGCAGLPWAAWCGDAVGRQVAGDAPDGVRRFLGWDRKALVPEGWQRVLGKPVVFGIDLVASKTGLSFKQ